MRLIKCYIENFGLLHTAEFSFSKGLNCCISDNGTGKTTLAAFIEAMLYGIGDTRRQSLDENPRKKYMPWQGGRFGGSLTVEVGKKRYVIERSFGQRPADDTFRLLDADSGKVSADFGENVGECLFGIDRDGFLRTVYLSEKNISGTNDNKSISAKLSDLVGVDGDVGGFDEAIKLLEERRKFYFKKGNTGEIANVRERILEVDRELDSLSRLKSEAEEKQEQLRALAEEKQRLQGLENGQRVKLEAIHRQRERTVNEERYATLLEALESEKRRLEEAKGFFAAGVPTTTEIDRARDLYVEGLRLRDEASSQKGDEEYSALSEFFKNGIDPVEIAEMQRCAELADEKTRQLMQIDTGTDEYSKEMNTIFPKKAPRREEVESAKRLGGKRNVLPKSIALALGVIMLALGLILGKGYGYAIAAVGAVLAVISVVLLLKPSKSKELLSFISEFGVDSSKSPSDAISEIEKKLSRYEQLIVDRTERRELLHEERCSLTLKVCAFLEKYPILPSSSMLESVLLIKAKYSDYLKLGMAGENAENGKVAKLNRSTELMKASNDFLSKYPTSSSDPFTEIRERLSELTHLSASVNNLNMDCDRFAVKYNVTGKLASVDGESEVSIKASISELSEKQRQISATSAVVEKELQLIRESVDREDELKIRKEELEELYKKHVRSLEVIKKTSAYLSEACDNITSKYIGKTKKKFEEYSKLIAGIDGEYTLNTSFELSKTERGESHGIEAYSRGMRDMYALGLRLALVDALYEKELPFIILDDPFIALDDSKLERAKAALKAIGKSRQIIYFTCAKAREIE